MKNATSTFKRPANWLLLCSVILLAQACALNTNPAVGNGSPSPDEINRFIDNWHMAAANAQAVNFYGSMADSSVYIGTDATERWTKPQFITFAKPYFDRGKAWDFKPYDRDLHVTKDGQYVWFSELLTTWMGVCRGSGILRNTPEGWKIEQYHLSVTVPNGAIRDFITLVDHFNDPKK